MNVIFWAAGFAAIAAAAAAVTRENPIYAAIWTLVSLGAVAVEFLLLHSGFLAAMQVLLYAGAIMVLFVFVIMLLSLRREDMGEEPPMLTKGFAGAVALAVFLVLAQAARSFPVRDGAFPASDARVAAPSGADFGTPEHFGTFLYGTSLVPFELVSVLLTAALAAVMILARKRVILGAEEGKPHAGYDSHKHGQPPSPAGPQAPTPQALEATDIKKPETAGAHS
jgi:NADH-quinone oxidoreductase subunit J